MGRIIVKGFKEPVIVSNDKAEKLQDDWIGGKLSELMRIGGAQFKSEDIKMIIVDPENVRQDDSQFQEEKKVQKFWEDWLKQDINKKAKWWFKHIFMTYYALQDKMGMDYEGFKKRLGQDKMLKVYAFINDWYKENPDKRWPPREEYDHFLPAPREQGIKGWKHIINCKIS